MQSGGGLTPSQDAENRPVFALESGPAAGVLAAVHAVRDWNRANVISFDMGGTTAKATIIEDGQVSYSTQYEVGSTVSVGNRLAGGGGELLIAPGIDIAEVGVGGWKHCVSGRGRRAAQRGRRARTGLLSTGWH